MTRRTRLQIDFLEQRRVPSGFAFEALPASRDLDVVAARFFPGRLVRPLAEALAHALNYGAGAETLQALTGPRAAAPLIPSVPTSPVFVGIVDSPTTALS